MSVDDDRESQARGFEVVDRRRLVMGGLAAAAGVGVVASAAAPAAAANGGPVLLGTANTASATTKVSTTGGHGLQASSSATGGYGVLATSTKANAIFGQSAAAGYTAVLGKNTNTTTGGWGVRGLAGTKGTGVRGETSDPNGWGVHGVHWSGGSGVNGFCSNGNGLAGNSDTGTGVYGASGNGTGVYGTCSDGVGDGVVGLSESGKGVYGVSAFGYGVLGWATGAGGIAVLGLADENATVAGSFHGSVQVTGTLTKGGGSFRIDHPVDPAHKFLSHSFVESPDMKNIYDGVVILDDSGAARVEMPDWFDALNRDFRYQLTALGGAAPDLHVSSEIEDRAFTIAGGGKGQKVSWQVTGIRQDAWANAYRIPVEEEKTLSEHGRYLHPELVRGGGKPLLRRPKPPHDPTPSTQPKDH